MSKTWFAALWLVLLLLPIGSVHAWTGRADGRVIFGQDFTLKSGDTLDGDLVVFGGAVTIEQTAAVKGNVVVIGGTLTLDGSVGRDAVVIGGEMSMGAKSSVAGDVYPLGGTLQRAEGSQIGGKVVTNVPPGSFSTQNGSEVQTAPFVFTWNPLVDAFATLVWAVIWGIVVGAIGMLLVIFLHPQLDRAAQAITVEPLMAGGIGLLTIVIVLFAVPVLGLLAFTVILAPVTLPLAFLIVSLVCLAWLFGVIALGMEVGSRGAQMLHLSWAPVASTGVGTFLLMFVSVAAGVIPCVGWLFPAAIGLLGIGAAAMTWFGFRPIHRPPLPAVAPAPPAA
jgi:hypothetical protein